MSQESAVIANLLLVALQILTYYSELLVGSWQFVPNNCIISYWTVNKDMSPLEYIEQKWLYLWRSLDNVIEYLSIFIGPEHKI